MQAYESLMHVLITEDSTDFGDVAITMAQARVLHVLAAGPIHMSELVARLRVTPSTTSGLVERLVEQGLAIRIDDPADRRQVIVSVTPAGTELMDRFRELSTRQLRELLECLSVPDLDVVRQSLRILHEATATRRAGAAQPSTTSHPPALQADQGRPK